MRSLFNLLRSLTVFAMALQLAPAASAVTFADGQVHVIDADNSFPFEGVTVNDGPGPITTTVNLVEGGAIGTLNPSELLIRALVS